MPAAVACELQRRKAAKQVECDGKDLASAQPKLAPKCEEAGPCHDRVDCDRNCDVARHVPTRRYQFKPREQQQQCASRPGAKPTRVRQSQRQLLTPGSRQPFTDIKKRDPGVNQPPGVSNKRAKEAESDPPDDPDRDRSNILER